MEVIVVVLNETDVLNELLTKFMEKDIKGATVIDSGGMGHLIAHNYPMFAMFAELEDERENNSKTIFVVSDDTTDRDRVTAALEEVLGDLSEPNTAIVFSLPVNYARGISF